MLSCVSIRPNVFYSFILITVIIISVVIVLSASVPGSEGVRTIPGAVRIPPYIYGQPKPENIMPESYKPKG
jgi:hypothetical protein